LLVILLNIPLLIAWIFKKAAVLGTLKGRATKTVSVDGQLHLITFSQLLGGTSDWESPFNILIQWLRQTNLPIVENPWMTFLSLSLTKLNVKATLVYPSMF
jgi:hypothetical protein